MEKEIGTRALPMKKLYNSDVFAEYLLRYWKWRWEIHALLYATFYKQHETQILIRYNLLSQKKKKKNSYRAKPKSQKGRADRQKQFKVTIKGGEAYIFWNFMLKISKQWGSLVLLIKTERVEKPIHKLHSWICHCTGFYLKHRTFKF